MRRSRLSRKYQKKSTQTLILSVLGIAAVLFLLFRYGIPLISEASFLFGRITSSPGTNTNQNKNNENFVPVPTLDSLPKATRDEAITISGTSLSGLKVALYVNGNKENETDVSSDGTFEFSIGLSEGENIIKAKAIKEDKESEFSNSITISFIKEGPGLSIDAPADNTDLKGQNPIEVKGKTDRDVHVTVNDFQAVSGNDGSYSYLLTLKEGGNEIKVVATDLAGNKTEKTIRVSYSP
ncbi:MAG: hypothetical protein HYW63_03730 [Candidatus Levybacteria bacterium]|nr:hypothetical protein [Candidatus Levybacteria bacterium]